MSAVLHLDHAASTPVRVEALTAFTEALGSSTGNPSAGHADGRAARTVLEDARERLAAALGRSPHEVVFTSGGTEADQLALVGLFRGAAAEGRRHIVCSAVEHPAVLGAVGWLAEHEGATVTWLEPRSPRPLRCEEVAAALRDDTALVAVTAADGEVGIAQPADVADAALARDVPAHRDAVQAVATGHVPRTGSLAVSGHKLGAPVGIGAALLPRSWPTRPLVEGPGQERGLRSGTQPAALAAALAVAVELAVAETADRVEAGRTCARALVASLDGLDGLSVTAPAIDDASRLATHVHITIDGVDGEALGTALDAAGVAVSTGTACATGTARPSRALEASGIVADAALRCSFGRETTAMVATEAGERIVDVVRTLRRAGGGFL